MIVEALRSVLVADAAVTAALATWEFTTGSPEPAIFTTERIPDKCAYPAVIMNEIGGANWGCRGNEGNECFARLRIYGDKNWNLARVRNVAWIIVRALDRAALDAHLLSFGYASALCIVDPPGYLPDPDGFPGFVINVRVLVMVL